MKGRILTTRAIIAAVGFAASAASAQTYIMVPDATNDRIALFNAADGSLFNPTFIVNQAGVTFTTPKDAIQVNDQVWVSDQVNDAVYRFNLAGVLLGQIGGGATGGMNNVRGMHHIGNTVYVASSDTGNASPGANAIIMFDTAGNNTGFFFTGSGPFDIFPLSATELLVSGGNNNPDVTRHDLAGAPLGTWHNGSISFAQQINRRANGEFIIAGFTDGNIRRYDSTGLELGVLFAAPGARGAIELDNGNILWTGGSGATAGVHVRNLTTGGDVLVMATTGAQFANRLTLAESCYANCDGSTGSPILTANDFQCFLNRFAEGAPYANCDGSTGTPSLTANDFQCFLNEYAAGCS